MTTSIPSFAIEVDQEVGVTLTFMIEASGRSEDNFTITEAILLEAAVWLDPKQAEEPAEMCINRTAWLNEYLKRHECDQQRLEEKLAEQWEKDRELDEFVYSNPSWETARRQGVD